MVVASSILPDVRQHVSDSLSRRHERGSFAPLAMSARALHVLCMLVERRKDLPLPQWPMGCPCEPRPAGLSRPWPADEDK
jgi:hypothetical protein